MNPFARMLDSLTGGVARRHAELYEAGVIPPPREQAGPVSITEAATLPAVQRALTILTTSAAQLSIDVERGGARLTGADVPALVRRPNLDMSRSEFVSKIVLSMATTGNAYLFREGGPLRSETTQLTPLDPHKVHPWQDDTGRVQYDYDGRTYGTDRIEHLTYLAMPGQLKGVGPIQAAQTTMRSARDMRSYASQWWETGQPSGILTTDAALTAEQAQQYRNVWNHLDENGNRLTETNNPSRVRVLGKGLSYEPILISPKDALWIEAQSFDTLEIARIFGVPSSLMMTALDGNSMTYSNVEQEWIGFVRFGLFAYLRPIEEALTALSPRGQTIRFNLEALLRSDTTTRYQAHATAIAAGFLTINEVRAIENMPPLPGGDTPSPSPAPADQEITA